MGWISFILFFFFFFGCGGGMCCSGPVSLPAAVTSGLTCEWEPGRRERVGVCGGKGRVSPSLLPLDHSLPSSLWLLWIPGQFVHGG